MRVLTCTAARRRLHAYHDGDLSVTDQIDVGAHLDWCDHCAGALADMQLLRSALRGLTRSRAALTAEEGASLQSALVSRIGAENATAFSVRLSAMFNDLHLVYAGLGAAAATVASVMLLLSMIGSSTERAEARLPGSNENPVVVDARTLLPRALDDVLMTVQSKGADEVFTLSAVVTREGRIINLELLSQSGQTLQADSSEAQGMRTLLGEVSRARFEPARVAGLPVAVNMVWMVAHMTVRALKTPEPLTAPSPSARRGSVSVPARPARHIVQVA